MKRFLTWVTVVAVLVAPFLLGVAHADAKPAERVVMFTMPGVNWELIEAADTPVFDALSAKGAVAALVVRSATRGMAPVRGYATLGAGHRAYATIDDVSGHRAFDADTELENDTARDVAFRRYGANRSAAIVHTDLGVLTRRFIGRNYGAKLGSLGEAVHEAGLKTGLVAAGDIVRRPDVDSVRRAAALAVVDHSGAIDTGTVSGLLRRDRRAPYGVRTDPDAFEDAVTEAMDEASVIAIDPGETQRADEFSVQAASGIADAARIEALERSDALLGRVVSHLSDDDLLMVVSPSGPRTSTIDQLTPMLMHGAGIKTGWLTSTLTRRDGLVLLTDVAATTLAALEVPIPPSISESSMSVVPGDTSDAIGRFIDLDRQSTFRELFVTVATVMLIALLIGLTFATLAVFLTRSPLATHVVRALALAVLALPLAALGVRIVDGWRLGAVGATLLLIGFILLLSAMGSLGRQRARGGLALLLLGLGFAVVDLLLGAPWQLNGVFGYSPIQAGRFYGNGNLGFAVLITCGIVGLTALADARGHRRPTWWLALGLIAVVVIEGLPPLGADFGGVLAGVPAACVAWVIARNRRVKARTVVSIAAGAAIAGVSLMLLDLLRPAAQRTHLGSLAASVRDEGLEPLILIVRRKAEANIHLLVGTRWTWVVPITAALLALLFWRGRGLLGGTLVQRPLLRAGLFGALTAGIVGMVVNDSGIAVPAMVLVLTVPFFVLVGLDELATSSHARPQGVDGGGSNA